MFVILKHFERMFYLCLAMIVGFFVLMYRMILNHIEITA